MEQGKERRVQGEGGVCIIIFYKTSCPDTRTGFIDFRGNNGISLIQLY